MRLCVNRRAHLQSFEAQAAQEVQRAPTLLIPRILACVSAENINQDHTSAKITLHFLLLALHRLKIASVSVTRKYYWFLQAVRMFVKSTKMSSCSPFDIQISSNTHEEQHRGDMILEVLQA